MRTVSATFATLAQDTAREWIDQHGPIPTLFHGTSRRAWERNHKAGTLYLSSDLNDAVSYAYEAAARDEGEGLAPDPIVVVVDDVGLALLLRKGGQVQPDFGWVEGLANRHDRTAPLPTWQESLAACHGLCISPVRHRHKVTLPVRTVLEIAAEAGDRAVRKAKKAAPAAPVSA